MLALLTCNGSIHYLLDKLPLASAGVMASSNTSYENRFVSDCVCVEAAPFVQMCANCFQFGSFPSSFLYLTDPDLTKLLLMS